MRAAYLFVLASLTLSAQAPRPGTSFVGVMVQEIDGTLARTLKLPEEAGVQVTRIEPESPAEKAGLKTGDVILEYNGQRVEGMEEFSRLVRETPPGREVKLGIYRGGASQTIALRVGARPAAPAGSWDMQRWQDQLHALQTRMPDLPRSFLTWRSSMLGIDAESLNGQLAAYFGVKEGVLVRSVSKDSPAEHAGIKAGDVILRVNRDHTASPADIFMTLRAIHTGSASVALMRDHREMTLTVNFPDQDRAGMK